MDDADGRTATVDAQVTPGELVARADALRPRLLEEQAATEERTRHSSELHEEFSQAGFYRILKPRRYGGYELDVATFYRVMISISRGCPSTGWMLALGSAHSMTCASYWSEQAQDEVLGGVQDFIAPFSWAFENAEAKPVDGGYLVHGTWHFASGVPYATHHMGLVPLAGAAAGESPQMMAVIIPAGQFKSSTTGAT